MSKAKIMNERDKTKRPPTPRLRFPEFQDDWRSQPLGDLASIIKEKAGNNKCTLMSIMTGVGLISQIDKFGKEIAGDQYKNYIVIRNNDFAYNKSATKDYPQGFIALYSGTEIAAVPNSIFTCFKVQTDNIVPAYLKCLFLCNFHGKWLKKYITVGARAHGALSIDDDDLLSLPVPYPKGVSPSSEQQRIADCLSSLDERITAETSKLDTLKDHKKGLLQQLFPAEGETLPQLRFPEFRDEWTYDNLGDFLEEYSEKVNADTTLPIYSSTRDGLKAQKDYFNGHELINSGEYGVVPVNCFVYRHMSDDNIFIFNINLTEEVIAVSKEYPVFKAKNMSLLFLYYILNYGLDFKRFAAMQKKGGTRTRLYFSTLCSWKTLLPTKPEQQRIADCLSSLDKLITAQAQKIDLLKSHKKGLMQQLFPIVDKAKA